MLFVCEWLKCRLYMFIRECFMSVLLDCSRTLLGLMSRFVNVDLVPGCIHAIPVLVRESQCMWVWLATGYELSVTLNKFELLDQAIVTAAGREAA